MEIRHHEMASQKPNLIGFSRYTTGNIRDIRAVILTVPRCGYMRLRSCTFTKYGCDMAKLTFLLEYRGTDMENELPYDYSESVIKHR